MANDPTELNPPNKSDAPTGGMVRYGQILQYLSYENTVYWTRHNFFMLCNTGLLWALIGNLFPKEKELSCQAKVLFAVLCVVGIAWSIIWHRTLDKSTIWLNKWHTLLKRLEPAAYGDLLVFRQTKEEEQKKIESGDNESVKTLALCMVRLFIVVWLILLAYGVSRLFGYFPVPSPPVTLSWYDSLDACLSLLLFI